MNTAARESQPAPRRARALPLREAELSRLWAAQTIPPEALVTTDGRAVQLRYRGRRGAGPGPDFRDAVVWVDVPAGSQATGWVRGDIELHVRASDFVRHGHHLDRAYLRLALHVVFEHDGGPTTLLDGRTVPVVALGRWVQLRAGEIRLALAAPDAYHEPCHSAVERLGVDAVAGALRDGGILRLREKAARLLPLIDELGPGQALYVALARGLGLTRDVAPMEAVARALPLAELRALAAASGEPAVTMAAALLGVAGLLGGQLALLPASEAGADADARLRAVWQRLGAPLARAAAWDAVPRRPGTGPRERLRALAALVLRPGPPLDMTLDGERCSRRAAAPCSRRSPSNAWRAATARSNWP